jgi:hypothetical protein
MSFPELPIIEPRLTDEKYCKKKERINNNNYTSIPL